MNVSSSCAWRSICPSRDRFGAGTLQTILSSGKLLTVEFSRRLEQYVDTRRVAQVCHVHEHFALSLLGRSMIPRRLFNLLLDLVQLVPTPTRQNNLFRSGLSKRKSFSATDSASGPGDQDGETLSGVGESVSGRDGVVHVVSDCRDEGRS